MTEEYLSIAELSSRLKVKPKTIKNKFEAMMNTTSLDENLKRIVREALAEELIPLKAQLATLTAVATNGRQGAAPYLTIGQAAKLTHCHPQTIRGYVRKGHLGAKHIATRVLISRSDLDSFLSRKS